MPTHEVSLEGYIGYFALEDWWASAFTDDERDHIVTRFRPLDVALDLQTSETAPTSPTNPLTHGRITSTSQTAIALLLGLAGWFAGGKERPIAHKILDKAFELAKEGARMLDRHFLYSQAIQIFYKDRDNPAYMSKAIDACVRQIGIAPEAAKAFRAEYPYDSTLPSHKGYEQLAIILEKEGRLAEAIQLCEDADAQEWSGDWDRRIERCAKKAGLRADS